MALYHRDAGRLLYCIAKSVLIHPVLISGCRLQMQLHRMAIWKLLDMILRLISNPCSTRLQNQGGGELHVITFLVVSPSQSVFEHNSPWTSILHFNGALINVIEFLVPGSHDCHSNVCVVQICDFHWCWEVAFPGWYVTWSKWHKNSVW